MAQNKGNGTMAILPGWNSIESTGWWSNFHFWFGIVCLFLLGFSEVLSHYYGTRRDELVATADSARTIAAQEKYTAAEKHHATELGSIKADLSDAQQRVAELKAFQQQRHLSDTQKHTLVSALSKFRGTKISIGSLFGDSDGEVFRDDFVEVLNKAEWSLDGHIGKMEISPTPFGVFVRFNQAEATAGRVPDAAVALVESLVSVGVTQKDANGKLPMAVAPDQAVDRFDLVIGAKAKPQ